jgi:hypothetical protein
MKTLINILVVLVLGVSMIALAQVPNKISYQGLLTTSAGTPVTDGGYDLKFDIYNLPIDGSLKYTETQTGIPVSRGTFSVIFHPTSTIFAESLFVEVTALAGPGISTPLTFSPRSELTSAPYSLSSWNIKGNTNTTAGTNFVGTTDAQAFDIRTNNVLRTRITTKGQIETYNTGQSVFVGEGAGTNDDLGANGNVFVGYRSGFSNTVGYNNTANGFQSLYSNSNGYNNTANGFQSLYSNSNGYNNTANGWQSLYSNSTGDYNTANGRSALYLNSTGNQNTANGSSALYSNTTGSYNTANGIVALYSNSTGNYNTALGRQAGYNSEGDSNVFLGNQAGYNETGSNKLYIANSLTNPPLIYGDFSTGNVGLGTVSPAEKLQVAGTIHSTSGGFKFPDGTSQITAASIPSGVIVMWSGLLINIPAGWALCNGANGTPDLRDRFIWGASDGENPGVTGGSTSHTHSVNPPNTQTTVPNEGSNVIFGSPAPVSFAASEAHTHDVNIASFTSGSTTTLPPYFKLAFIMKL